MPLLVENTFEVCEDLYFDIHFNMSCLTFWVKAFNVDVIGLQNNNNNKKFKLFFLFFFSFLKFIFGIYGSTKNL